MNKILKKVKNKNLYKKKIKKYKIYNNIKKYKQEK